MKLFLKLVLFMFLPLNLFLAELDLEKNFKAGDTVSAATFNEIHAALEKINKIPQDSDLLGTWTCSGFKVGSFANWTAAGTAPFNFSKTQNVTFTFTSSGSSTSFETPYSYVSSDFIFVYNRAASSPQPYNKLNGTYVLYDGLIFMSADWQQPTSESLPVTGGKIKFLSPTRFGITGITDVTHTVICDKQS